MSQIENKGAEYDFYGKMPLKKAIPLGMQHVLAMFVGNLTPIILITGACGLGAGTEFADLQVALLQNAMLIAGIVTLIQLFAIGPVGGNVPIIMGTKKGRENDEEITVYDTVGMGVQDLAMAKAIYENALKAGIGSYFDFNA